MKRKYKKGRPFYIFRGRRVTKWEIKGCCAGGYWKLSLCSGKTKNNNFVQENAGNNHHDHI